MANLPQIKPGSFVKLRGVTILKKNLQQRSQRGGPESSFVETFFLLNAAVGDSDRVRLDTTSNQSHTQTVKATENPVEDGSKITDHSVRQPAQLSVSGTLTDTPLGLLGAPGLSAAFTTASRAIDEFNKLQEIVEAREPVFVATSVKYYQNMLITSLKVTRTPKTGNALDVTLTLKEIRIVSPSFGADLVDTQSTRSSSGSAEVVDAGRQSTAPYGA